jgi:hypothetical protein
MPVPEMPTWFLLLPFVAVALGAIVLLLLWLTRGRRDDGEEMKRGRRRS